MSTSYPHLDKRRSLALYQELRSVAGVMLPEWQPDVECGDEFNGEFLSALLRISAQLTEHVSGAIDATPQRDQLAFFDMLDIPAESPRAAECPVVFVLAGSHEDPVYAPAASQVSANVDGDEYLFETMEGIHLTPARLTSLVLTDGEKDVIEISPPGFLELAKPSSTASTFAAITTSQQDSQSLQLSPAGFLQENDLVRIGDTTYDIAKSEEDLVELKQPLESDFGPNQTLSDLEKVTQFDVLSMRDRQEHILYIGHETLFKLSEPTTILLNCDPPEVNDLLRREGDISWEMYGAIGDAEPAWIKLSVGFSEQGLELVKAWRGDTVKVQVGATKSFFIRAQYRGAISGFEVAESRSRRINLLLKSGSSASVSPTEPEESLRNCPCSTIATSETIANVESEEESSSRNEGSRTITQAFHNGTPLPLTTRFMPFGAEPRRFDTFAMAIPEVLSKKDAKATLHIALPDTSIQSIEIVTGSAGPQRAYAIGSNGAVQGLIMNPDLEDVHWSQLGQPQTEDLGDEQANLSLNSLALDPDTVPQVLEISGSTQTQKDLVVVKDNSGAIWALLVDVTANEDEVFTNQTWRLLAEASDNDTASDLLLLKRKNAFSSPPYYALVLQVEGDELKALKITRNLVADRAGFQTVGGVVADVSLGSSTRLIPLLDAMPLPASTDFPMDIVLLDEEKEFWTFRINRNLTTTNWQQINYPSSMTVSNRVRPAAVHQPGGTSDWVVYGGLDSNGSIEGFVLDDPANATGISTILQDGTAFQCLPGALGNDSLAVIWGEDPATHQHNAILLSSQGLFLPTTDQLALPLPRPEQTLRNAGLLFQNNGVPELLVNVGSETIARNSLGQEVPFVANTILRATQQIQATHLDFLDQNNDRHFVPYTGSPLFTAGGEQVHALSPFGAGIDPAPGTWALWQASTNLSGIIRGGGTSIELEPGDNDTVAGKILFIGLDPFEVSDVNQASITDPRIATLSTSTGLSNNTPVTYQRLDAASPVPSVTVTDDDFNRLINISDAGGITSAPSTIGFSNVGSPPSTMVGRVVDSTPAGSGFWLLLDPALTASTSGATAHIFGAITDDWVTHRFPRGYQNPELAWEYFDSESWRRIESAFVDATDHLSRSGKISFKVPANLAQTDVAGQNDYWIRARLVGGDYGQARYFVESEPAPTGSNSTHTLNVDTSGLQPPEILTIEASFELLETVAPDYLLVQNNLGIKNQTEASLVKNAEFSLFEGVAKIDGARGQRTLYLGFNKDFGNGSLSFFIDAEDQIQHTRLIVEVLTETDPEWIRVSHDDETQGFHRRGYLRVSAEATPVNRRLFGQDSFWLRIRPDSNASSWAPNIRSLFVNAIGVEQVQTLTQELLGSSTGEQAQHFVLSRTPVLPTTIELRVRESLSVEEERVLRKGEENLALSKQRIREFPELSLDGHWVLWQAVDSFVNYGPNDRVYRLDASTGEVSFGRFTKSPPPGRDNIRAIQYKTGGGISGNIPAFKIDAIKSDLPGIEKVTNPVRAAGGTEAPSLDMQAIFAPARIRHNRQAMSPADIEALIVASSPLIQRSRCLFPVSAAGPIRVAVAIASGDRCAQPSLAERQQLEKLVRDQAWGGLNELGIEIVGPDYIGLELDMVLLAESPQQAAALEKTAKQKLYDFLHPLEGGMNGNGWPFARMLRQSDLLRLLEQIPEFDRAEEISPLRKDGLDPEHPMPAFGLICIDRSDITVTVKLVNGGTD